MGIISTLETTSPDPFPHAFGNCSWTCSYSSDPSSFLANGRRTTIFPTQYRVRSTLLTASKSIKDLIDPIPVTVVWFYEVPNPNGCGTVDVTGSKSIETAAYTDLNRCPLLTFPATGMSKGGPTLLLSVRTDVK